MFGSTLKWATMAVAIAGIGLGCTEGMSCHGGGHGAAPAGNPNSPALAGAPANAMCPIMGGKVNPDKTPAELTRQFQGQTVGFCCGGCPAAWDRLSDEQKAAKMAKLAPKAAAPDPHAGQPH